MAFVNKVILMGNLTRDPELRQLPSGSAVCDFGLAMNRKFKNAGGEEKEETVFVDCTAWARTGEVIAQYAKKGRSLFVEGRLNYETWEDKTGNRRSKLSLVVEQFQFVGNKADGEGGGDGPPRQAAARPAPASPRQQQRSGYAPRGGYQGEPEATGDKEADDLPF